MISPIVLFSILTLRSENYTFYRGIWNWWPWPTSYTITYISVISFFALQEQPNILYSWILTQTSSNTSSIGPVCQSEIQDLRLETLYLTVTSFIKYYMLKTILSSNDTCNYINYEENTWRLNLNFILLFTLLLPHYILTYVL